MIRTRCLSGSKVIFGRGARHLGTARPRRDHRSIRLLACSCALVAVLVLPIPAGGAAAPGARTYEPTQRLLDVWLDLQLVIVFYPTTEPAKLAANLQRVARQLGQPPLMIRHGRRPRDTLRFPPGAVLIKPDTPPGTLVMFARSTRGIFELVDAGALRVFRVRN